MKTPVIENVAVGCGDTIPCDAEADTLAPEAFEGDVTDVIPPSSKRISLSSFGSEYAEFLFERFAA